MNDCSQCPVIQASLALIRQGRNAECRVTLAACRAREALGGNAVERFHHEPQEAQACLGMGHRQEGMDTQQQALAFGRESGIEDDVLSQAPDLLASLCA